MIVHIGVIATDKFIPRASFVAWRQNMSPGLKRMKSVPRRLKPEFQCGAYGTGEPAPLSEMDRPI
jgi:hypothetical protein